MDVTNKNFFSNIKNNYRLKQIFKNLQYTKLLKILKHNQNLQKRLDIGLNDYKTFYDVELEIIPKFENLDKDKNIFINIPDYDSSYYHIYFNDSTDEIKRNYFDINDKVAKIKVILNFGINSFDRLFCCCSCIQKISIIKFDRNDINSMVDMFCGCSSLTELDLNKFNTINVTNMCGMFCRCSSLEKLNLKNLNTSKVFFIK